ncbi:MAG: GAF domain-containing protein [Thermomicrobia bacterium]|nr:GAF domain-containing protein [Thermomicrobia bacterium]MCA1724440.1 GAF domain-containing protein [Thermomicrobia bacterium]
MIVLVRCGSGTFLLRGCAGGVGAMSDGTDGAIMRHTLQSKLLVFGIICFVLTASSSTIQLLQFHDIAQASDTTQVRYDLALDDSARLREEVIRLIARIKDVWLRGGKTDSIDAVAALVEQSWQTINDLRVKLSTDLDLTPAMHGPLQQYDQSIADYRSSYLQTLAQYRIEIGQADGANADTHADSALKGQGLVASGLIGNLQDAIHVTTAQIRADQRARINTARNVTLLETGILLAVIGLAGLWLVRTIGRGVGDVALAAAALGRGARDVVVPIRGEGEIAQLGRAFNGMVKELNTQEQQLEELRRIAVALTSATTEHEVCAIVVHRLAETFGYHYVSIYLLRPGDPDNLHLICQHGYTTVIDPIPVPGTVTGRAVRERRPILIRDAAQDSDFIAAEHQIVCEACAPILTPDRVLGALLLEEEDIARLSESDLNLITTLAHNVSVALENVRLTVEAEAQIASLASANREMQRLNAELTDANALKSEFLAMMSHELRTPLNAIIGFSELLADGIVTDADEINACLHDILNSGRHLLHLINDVLDISKIEAGRMELKRTVFDIREELDGVRRAVAPLIAARGHQLLTDEPSAPVAVCADRQRLRQIILNLVSNAIKFTPDGGTVTMHVTTDPTAAALVAVSVRDTGIGIKEDDFPKLFEKFRQLDASHNRRYEGTGLGLALTKQLVELNGGTIHVESVVGCGSVFTFTLPAALDPSPDDDDRALIPQHHDQIAR